MHVELTDCMCGLKDALQPCIVSFEMIITHLCRCYDTKNAYIYLTHMLYGTVVIIISVEVFLYFVVRVEV